MASTCMYGNISCEAFGKGTDIAYYYESLVHVDLTRRQHMTSRFEEHIMKLIKESFLK